MIDQLLRRSPSTPSSLRRWRDGLAIAVAALIAVAVMAVLPKEPDHLGQLNVRNPTPYELHLAIGHPDGSTTPIGYAAPDASSALYEVIVPSGTWTLVVTSEARRAGEVEVDSDQMEEAGWTLDIPEPIGDVLADLGVQPRT